MQRWQRLPHTLTLWTTVAGIATVLAGKRRQGAFMMRIAGLGGIGAAYGHYAATHGINVEPVPIAQRFVTHSADREDYLISILWHGLIWLAAEVIDD